MLRTGLRRLLGVSALGCGVAAAADPESAESFVRSVPRASRALATAASIAADQRYSVLGLDELSSEHAAAMAAVHERSARRLLWLCRTNGGIYIKTGQYAATVQPVPAPIREALSSLQDAAPSRPFHEISAMLRRELGPDAVAEFARIEPEAAAAASLAQVHRAQLRDGRRVALKVQHAGLEAAVAADMATLRLLAAAAFALAPAGSFPDLGWALAEMHSNLTQELDFLSEAANAQRLERAVSQRRGGSGGLQVAVPQVFPHLSSARVLTMEWIEGIKASDAEALAAAGMAPAAVGEALVRLVGVMCFCLGFVHGDLHPGNVLVRPFARSGAPPAAGASMAADGAGGGGGGRGGGGGAEWGGAGLQPQLVVLDHGLYTELSEGIRLDYCRLWQAIAVGNARLVAEVGARLDGRPDSAQAWALLVQRPPHAAQRQAARREAGVGTPQELGEFLEALPRPVAVVLRTQGLVRNTAEALGVRRPRRTQIMLQDATEGLTWRCGAPLPGRWAAAHASSAAVLMKVRAAASVVAVRSRRILERRWMGLPHLWGAPPPPRGVVAWQ